MTDPFTSTVPRVRALLLCMAICGFIIGYAARGWLL